MPDTEMICAEAGWEWSGMGLLQGHTQEWQRLVCWQRTQSPMQNPASWPALPSSTSCTKLSSSMLIPSRPGCRAIIVGDRGCDVRLLHALGDFIGCIGLRRWGIWFRRLPPRWGRQSVQQAHERALWPQRFRRSGDSAVDQEVGFFMRPAGRHLRNAFPFRVSTSCFETRTLDSRTSHVHFKCHFAFPLGARSDSLRVPGPGVFTHLVHVSVLSENLAIKTQPADQQVHTSRSNQIQHHNHGH
eukprot:scaffold43212_cov71-Phaeocystis_antarctica.AAC.2